MRWRFTIWSSIFELDIYAIQFVRTEKWQRARCNSDEREWDQRFRSETIVGPLHSQTNGIVKLAFFTFHRNRRDFSFISGDWEVRANWTNWFLSENSHGNSTFIEKRLALAREQKHKIWCASVSQAASPNWIALHIYTNGCLCNARCWVIRSPKRNENRENDPTKAAQDSREEKKFLVSLCCRRSVFPCFRFIHSTPPCFFFSFPTSLAPFFPFAASVIIIIINGAKHLGWNRRGFD